MAQACPSPIEATSDDQTLILGALAASGACAEHARIEIETGAALHHGWLMLCNFFIDPKMFSPSMLHIVSPCVRLVAGHFVVMQTLAQSL